MIYSIQIYGCGVLGILMPECLNSAAPASQFQEETVSRIFRTVQLIPQGLRDKYDRGLMSQQRVNIKNEEDFLKLLLKVEAKDVNLKFVFDHIRNYGICGLMLGIGVKVLAHPDKSNFLVAVFDFLAGGLLFSLPWALFTLNFVHGISAFFAIRDAKEVNKYWYLAVSLLLFFPAGKLMIYALNL